MKSKLNLKLQALINKRRRLKARKKSFSLKKSLMVMSLKNEPGIIFYICDFSVGKLPIFPGGWHRGVNLFRSQ